MRTCRCALYTAVLWVVSFHAVCAAQSGHSKNAKIEGGEITEDNSKSERLKIPENPELNIVTTKGKISARFAKYKYRGEASIMVDAGDIDTAIKKAKDQARKDLADNIRIRITKTIVDIMGQSQTFNEEHHNTRVYSAFEQKVQSYTNIVIQGPDDGDWYLGYPLEGSVTYVMAASEETARKCVDDDLKAKLSPILTNLNAALESMRRKQFGAALTSLIKAKNSVEKDFAGMPMEGILKDNQVYPAYSRTQVTVSAKSLDVPAFVGNKLTELLNGIKLVALDKELAYTAEGRLIGDHHPMIQAIFVDKEGVKAGGIIGLPLKARFTVGKGRVSGKITTGMLEGVAGMAEVSVEYVDPSSRKAVLEIILNGEALGIDKEDLLLPDTLSIPLAKKKTIAFSAVFINSGETDELPQENIEALKDVLGSKNDFKDFVVGDPIAVEDMLRAKKELNADDLFIIRLEAKSSGPFLELYDARLSGEAKMFTLVDEREAFSVSCPCLNVGQHTSVSGSGLEALSSNWSGLLKKISNKLKAETK